MLKLFFKKIFIFTGEAAHTYSLGVQCYANAEERKTTLDNKRCDFLKSFFVPITTLGLKTWRTFQGSAYLLGSQSVGKVTQTSLNLNIMTLLTRSLPHVTLTNSTQSSLDSSYFHFLPIFQSKKSVLNVHKATCIPTYHVQELGTYVNLVFLYSSCTYPIFFSKEKYVRKREKKNNSVSRC